VLNTLMQAFQLTSLARQVAERTLRALGSELLIRLLDDRIPRLEEGTALLKALNILMLKILENSQRNYTFSALLLLLRVPPPPLDDPSGGAANDALRSKFCDLVVKCLIKLTKVGPFDARLSNHLI
jgi:cytoskeleton-associated protein 5